MQKLECRKAGESLDAIRHARVAAFMRHVWLKERYTFIRRPQLMQIPQAGYEL